MTNDEIRAMTDDQIRALVDRVDPEAWASRGAAECREHSTPPAIGHTHRCPGCQARALCADDCTTEPDGTGGDVLCPACASPAPEPSPGGTGGPIR